MSAQERVTIKIPKVLYNNIRDVIEGTGFNSVTDFIVYVLRDVVSSRGGRPTTPLSQDEVHSIKEKLTTLGYL
jgi:hypothetical protein